MFLILISKVIFMRNDEKIILQQFAKLLKELREKKYNSLNQFAFDSPHLTSATISRIENASVDFKFTTLVKLAYALDMSVSDLLKDFTFNYDDFEQ